MNFEKLQGSKSVQQEFPVLIVKACEVTYTHIHSQPAILY